MDQSPRIGICLEQSLYRDRLIDIGIKLYLETLQSVHTSTKIVQMEGATKKCSQNWKGIFLQFKKYFVDS